MIWIGCALHYQINFGTPHFDPKAQLTTAQVKLLSIDQTWKIECAFLESLVDGSGSSKLEEDFLALLPTAEGGSSLEQAIQKAQILASGKLAQFAAAGAVGSVKAGLKLLVCMQDGPAPSIPGNPSHFLQSVFSRLGFFAIKEVTIEGKKTIMRGKAAVEYQWAAVQKMDSASMKLTDLELLCVFGFLLAGTEQVKIAALAGGVFKSALHSQGSYGDVPGPVKGSKATASQVTVASCIHEAASMFK